MSEQSLDDLAGGIANPQVVRLPGCGHLAFVTRPEPVAAEVIRFFHEMAGIAVG